MNDTPQEALAEALSAIIDRYDPEADYIDRSGDAAAILAALPDGWRLVGPQESAALADGEALGALREALPKEALMYLNGPLPGWQVEIETFDGRTSTLVTGSTIAEAATAAREALR